MSTQDQPAPALRVVSGQPTDEELAAVTVLLLAIAQSAPAPAPERQVGGWADPAYRLRRPLPPGPGAWRASAWS
ncbi:MAG: acyl-CoA carboxylase subunit epsilon [Actinobacteria bacterium]|nr:acyl-CoA carboxylase subunit epsilon [Actinomycetota bacterium]